MREIISEYVVDKDGYALLEPKGELVRCGECRWWETVAKCETKNYGTCTIPLSHINTHCIVPEDYYCADGERKDGEHDS